MLLLLVFPFSSKLMTVWLSLTAVPYFILYARDLSILRYHGVIDFVRVYALNLLLLPVHLGGALKSVQQLSLARRFPSSARRKSSDEPARRRSMWPWNTGSCCFVASRGALLCLARPMDLGSLFPGERRALWLCHFVVHRVL